MKKILVLVLALMLVFALVAGLSNFDFGTNDLPIGGNSTNDKPTDGNIPGDDPTGGTEPENPPVGGNEPEDPPAGGTEPENPPVGGDTPSDDPAIEAEPCDIIMDSATYEYFCLDGDIINDLSKTIDIHINNGSVLLMSDFVESNGEYRYSLAKGDRVSVQGDNILYIINDENQIIISKSEIECDYITSLHSVFMFVACEKYDVGYSVTLYSLVNDYYTSWCGFTYFENKSDYVVKFVTTNGEIHYLQPYMFSKTEDTRVSSVYGKSLYSKVLENVVSIEIMSNEQNGRYSYVRSYNEETGEFGFLSSGYYYKHMLTQDGECIVFEFEDLMQVFDSYLQKYIWVSKDVDAIGVYACPYCEYEFRIEAASSKCNVPCLNCEGCFEFEMGCIGTYLTYSDSKNSYVLCVAEPEFSFVCSCDHTVYFEHDNFKSIINCYYCDKAIFCDGGNFSCGYVITFATPSLLGNTTVSDGYVYYIHGDPEFGGETIWITSELLVDNMCVLPNGITLFVGANDGNVVTVTKEDGTVITHTTEGNFVLNCNVIIEIS